MAVESLSVPRTISSSFLAVTPTVSSTSSAASLVASRLSAVWLVGSLLDAFVADSVRAPTGTFSSVEPRGSAFASRSSLGRDGGPSSSPAVRGRGRAHAFRYLARFSRSFTLCRRRRLSATKGDASQKSGHENVTVGMWCVTVRLPSSGARALFSDHTLQGGFTFHCLKLLHKFGKLQN